MNIIIKNTSYPNPQPFTYWSPDIFFAIKEISIFYKNNINKTTFDVNFIPEDVDFDSINIPAFNEYVSEFMKRWGLYCSLMNVLSWEKINKKDFLKIDRENKTITSNLFVSFVSRQTAMDCLFMHIYCINYYLNGGRNFPEFKRDNFIDIQIPIF